MLGRVKGIVWYELKMRLRSWLYWIIFILASGFSLFVPTPLNYPGPEDALRFYSDWWLAGQTFSALNFLMTLLAAFLVADRILRDSNLRIEEIIQSRPVSSKEYIIAKYMASMISLSLIAIPAIIGVPIIKRLLLGVEMNLLPLIIAFLVMYIPSMVFVASLSLTGTTFARSAPAFYGVFGIIWYFDSVYFRVAESTFRGVFNFSGTSSFQAFFSATALGFTNDMYLISAGIAWLNVFLLIMVSGIMITALIYHEKIRRGAIAYRNHIRKSGH